MDDLGNRFLSAVNSADTDFANQTAEVIAAAKSALAKVFEDLERGLQNALDSRYGKQTEAIEADSSERNRRLKAFHGELSVFEPEQSPPDDGQGKIDEAVQRLRAIASNSEGEQ